MFKCRTIGTVHFSFISLSSFQLYYLGGEYPAGAGFFRDKLKKAFMKNKDEKDPAKVDMLIKRGEFVVKEVEALYKLRKYRAMKQRYYEMDETNLQQNIQKQVEEKEK